MKAVSFTAYLTLSLLFSLFGIIFAVSWSLIFDFKEATDVYCGAKEMLPSVSHATGGFAPQKYVWKTCVSIHIGMRFLTAFMYYNWHMRVDVGRCRIVYQLLVIIAIASHFTEMFSLIVLTNIALSEKGKVHENAFLTFVWMSQFYMFLSCVLILWTHKAAAIKVTSKDIVTSKNSQLGTEKINEKSNRKKLLLIKAFLCVFNTIVFAICYKLFDRHAAYCEDYMHSMFAFTEYLTVLTNIIFHYLAIFDLKRYSVTFLATEDLVSGPFKND